MANLIDALHTYIDKVEDLTLDSMQVLAQRLSLIKDPRVWVGMSRADVKDAISKRLAAAVATDLFPQIEQVALDTLSAGGISNSKIKASLERIARSQQKEGGGRILPSEGVRFAMKRLQQGLEASLSDPLFKINKIISAAPQTRAGALAALKRVEREIIAPLQADPSSMMPAMKSAISDISQTTLTFADLRLDDPDVPPEMAAQVAADRPMRWVSVLESTCHDCLPRHGQLDRYAGWAERGLPRDGWSVCGENCKCFLAPDLFGAEYGELVDPLRRASMRIAEEGTPRGMTVRIPRELLEQESRRVVSRRDREDQLREAYKTDIRVRRAMRILGQSRGGEP